MFQKLKVYSSIHFQIWIHTHKSFIFRLKYTPESYSRTHLSVALQVWVQPRLGEDDIGKIQSGMLGKNEMQL